MGLWLTKYCMKHFWQRDYVLSLRIPKMSSMGHLLTAVSQVREERAQGEGGTHIWNWYRCRAPVFVLKGIGWEKNWKKMGSLDERQHFSPKFRGIGWEGKFWSFNENLSSPIEATCFEFLTLKRKTVDRIIWNNYFDVEIEKSLALGDRLKEKIGDHWVRAISFQ